MFSNRGKGFRKSSAYQIWGEGIDLRYISSKISIYVWGFCLGYQSQKKPKPPSQILTLSARFFWATAAELKAEWRLHHRHGELQRGEIHRVIPQKEQTGTNQSNVTKIELYRLKNGPSHVVYQYLSNVLLFFLGIINRNQRFGQNHSDYGQE